MNHQYILEASFIPTFEGLKVDGDLYFDTDNPDKRNMRMSITVKEAYFQHGKFWIVCDLFGPFSIETLYDANPESHIRGLAQALASAFINESRVEHPFLERLSASFDEG